MLDRIKRILNENNKLSGWKIHESHVISEELFFIKKSIDMNRSKNVLHYNVKVYVDFELEGEKYRGEAETNIHPTMSDEEITKVIEEAAYAASFVKNKYFPFVSSQKLQTGEAISSEGIVDAAIDISNSLYECDTHQNGWINSSEVFANKVYNRIVNSEDVDVSYNKDVYEVELITQWKENNQDVELYEMYYFSDTKNSTINDYSKEQLEITRDRSLALPMPSLTDIPIIISGEAVKKIFNYYVMQSHAQMVYEGISRAKIGESIQGDITGDFLNMKLRPMMEKSSLSAPVDADGKILKDVDLYTNGVLNTYHGSTQYASYLGIEPTGNISNFEVAPGSIPYEDMKKEPYIELLSFSSFQMSFLTGDLGGEIRLAHYFDGEKLIPVTGGSLSVNIKSIHNNMFYSKETTQINDYLGPKSVTFVGGIAGVK